MATEDTHALLDSLMARKGNSPEFILELEGYLDDLSRGELDGADKKYIRELAKRLDSGGSGDIIEFPDSDEHDDDESDDDESDGDSRFARAKAALRERFDPEALDPDAPDTALRREIYEEFRAELDRIEDEG